MIATFILTERGQITYIPKNIRQITNMRQTEKCTNVKIAQIVRNVKDAIIRKRTEQSEYRTN